MLYPRSWTILLFLVLVQPDVLHVLSYSNTLYKCCPKGEELLSIGGVHCYKVEASSPSSNRSIHELDWLPPMIIGSAGEELPPDSIDLPTSYRKRLPCADEDNRYHETLLWGPEDQEFRLYVNGSVLDIRVSGAGQSPDRFSFFSTEAYCADRVRGAEDYTHAVKLCFCTEKTCVQKCCPYETYLDIANSACTNIKRTLSNYQPVIYDDDILPLMGIPSNIFFIPAFPMCTDQSSYIYLNVPDKKVHTIFFIHKNGRALLVDDRSHYLINSHEYCFDLIQTDTETLGPNLVVCKTQKTKIFKLGYNEDAGDIMSPRSVGDSRTLNLFLLAIITLTISFFKLCIIEL